jgi:hypothetical protein
MSETGVVRPKANGVKRDRARLPDVRPADSSPPAARGDQGEGGWSPYSRQGPARRLTPAERPLVAPRHTPSGDKAIKAAPDGQWFEGDKAAPDGGRALGPHRHTQAAVRAKGGRMLAGGGKGD